MPMPGKVLPQPAVHQGGRHAFADRSIPASPHGRGRGPYSLKLFQRGVGEAVLGVGRERPPAPLDVSSAGFVTLKRLQHIVRVRGRGWLRQSLSGNPMASMVTIQPLRSSNSSSRGIAVISFDLVSTATWPSVSRQRRKPRASPDAADSCQPPCRTNPRSVLPSMATTSPATALREPRRATVGCRPSIGPDRDERRRGRRCHARGYRWASPGTCEEKSSLALLKRSMSAQPLALPAAGRRRQGG